MGTSKTPTITLPQYYFITFSLNIPRSLGLNMIEPHKPLIDSGLAVFLFPVSNKTATKVMKKPRFEVGAGQNKITNNIRHLDVAAKVVIFSETTKNRTYLHRPSAAPPN